MLAALAEMETLMPQHSTRLHERDGLTRRLETLRETYARSAANARAMNEPSRLVLGR
jgi:hypothetical protein